MEKIAEKQANKTNGFVMLFVLFALIALEVYLFLGILITKNTQILWLLFPLMVIIIIATINSVLINGYFV